MKRTLILILILLLAFPAFAAGKHTLETKGTSKQSAPDPPNQSQAVVDDGAPFEEYELRDDVTFDDCKQLTGTAKAFCCISACGCFECGSCFLTCMSSRVGTVVVTDAPFGECRHTDALIVTEPLQVQPVEVCPQGPAT